MCIMLFGPRTSQRTWVCLGSVCDVGYVDQQSSSTATSALIAKTQFFIIIVIISDKSDHQTVLCFVFLIS